MFDVVGIGLNAIDYLVGLPRFPVPGEKLRMSSFTREGGGQAATALVALSRWGCRCKYIGNVGDDEHGRLSSLLLSREGVDLAHVRTVPGASSQFAVILVEETSGERTILWDRDPRIRVSPEDVPLDDIRRARALLLDGHDVPPAIVAARTARAAGVPVVLDAEKVQEGNGGTAVPVRPHRGRGTLPGIAHSRGLGGRWRTGDPAAIRTQDGYGDAWLPRGVRMRRPGRDLLAFHPRRGGGHHGRRGHFPRRLPVRSPRRASLPGNSCLRQYRRRSLLPRNGGACRDPDDRGDPGGRRIPKLPPPIVLTGTSLRRPPPNRFWWHVCASEVARPQM